MKKNLTGKLDLVEYQNVNSKIIFYTSPNFPLASFIPKTILKSFPKFCPMESEK